MKQIELNQNILNEIEKTTETANYLWEREWAERNGGNISINLTEYFIGIEIDIRDKKFIETPMYPEEAANMFFFVTGTGKRLRELIKPDMVSCIIKFNENATGYYIIWGEEDNNYLRPTSELISHVKIHLDKLKTNSNHRAVVHTHPIETICMSHHPQLTKNEDVFNSAIWSMLPEVRAFVPRGVALCKYALPGSDELADLTVAALRKRDVAIWSKHGAIATGVDTLEAFDFIDVANKGCKIYMKCLASGFKPLGMTQDEMRELVEVFNL
ncbi:MAG TPA: rhamnulose-1-phosphate aldolase [Victivallales bacterium]|nr:rhamnulose-1-phosphate aldolase [Victivallales bacterium]